MVIINDPHPLCVQAARKRWRQMRKAWYVVFFQLPWLPERMIGSQPGAPSVRRVFRDVPLPADMLAVYSRQITEPGAATAMLNWYRAIRLRSSPTLDLAHAIDVPTLIVWGERDVAFDPLLSGRQPSAMSES